MKDFEKGTKKFQNEVFDEYKFEFQRLVKDGQDPMALFIGCCDSRVMPNLITNTGPGDLFIVRNIGNFVPPYNRDECANSTSAAIQYAVNVLKVKDIIVCGHSHCGAIATLFQQKQQKPELTYIYKWLKHGEKAKNFVKNLNLPEDKILKNTEMYSVLFQVENLLTYPGVKKRVEEKDLHINAWYNILEEGKVLNYNFEKEEYEEL